MLGFQGTKNELSAGCPQGARILDYHCLISYCCNENTACLVCGELSFKTKFAIFEFSIKIAFQNSI